MEIPVINRITDFEALQDPSVVTQIFSFSGIEKIYQVYGFWKWGALILALVASFSTIINRIKILIVHFKNHHLKPLPAADYYSDYSYDSDNESSCSSLSEAEEEEEDDEEEDDRQASSSAHGWRSIDEDFSVKGSGHYIDEQWQSGRFKLRKRRNSSIGDLFSWSEFANRKNVVKLWDNLGLGFRSASNNNNQTENTIYLYDMNKEHNIFSIFNEKSAIPAVSSSSSTPAVIVSGETNIAGNILRVWDTRVGSRIPQIIAEWRPRLGKIVGVNASDVEKVYFRDDVTGRLTVGDMRKVSSPLVNMADSDADTWWDADES